MTDREWTNLGQGLVDAQLMVLGTPYTDNNKVVAVLSDGEQNVNPMYDDISSSISVVVDTWGFSGDAPNALLSRIAAENGGNFSYVSTSPGSSLLSLQAEREALVDQLSTTLQDNGVSAEQSREIAGMLSVTSSYLPGGLGLADRYDYLHTEESGGARVAQNAYIGAPTNEWKVQSYWVGPADNTLLMVSSSSQPEYGSCAGWKREVEVSRPAELRRLWIPISPPSSTPPPNWDIRNSKFPSFSDALYVTNPEVGEWQMRTKMYQVVCTAEDESTPESATSAADFIMAGTVYSTISLDGQILLHNGQGMTGDPVPIVGTLLQKTGAVPKALVLTLVEKPGTGVDLFFLRDDGQSNDGAAGDGMYGNTYFKSTSDGAYNVTILALVEDPHKPGQVLTRFWKGSYYMKGEEKPSDDDPFPPWWEKRYPCMDPEKYNSPKDDYDKDGATNWDEWQYGTNPCDPDTDDGGERDGSEIKGGRNPHWPDDDKVRPIYNWSVRPLNQAILVHWSRPLTYTKVFIRVGGKVYDGGQKGELEIPLPGEPPLPNDVPLIVSLWGEKDGFVGTETYTQTVVPKLDPDPPSGFILINSDAPETIFLDVELYVNASDELLEGMPAPGGTATIANEYTADNEVSDGIKMRFSNGESGPWSDWEPFSSSKRWMMDCYTGEVCIVYAQFKDAAGNESLIVNDDILYTGYRIEMPIIFKR